MRPHATMPPSPLDAGRLAEQAARLAGEIQATARPPCGPPGAWQVPLLLADDLEVWLLGWPAGQATAAHDHGGATVALTVVEGALTEECLDPTIWTTGRRTTWRAGQTTVFPPDHVHLLGAAGDRPAVAVQAWSPRRWSWPSAGHGAALLRRGAGLDGGGGGGPGGTAAAGAGAPLGRGRAGQAEQPLDGLLDARHVGDRVPT
jgi:quercetin dioxygenase-like cupin family protein